jgi:hypothetical protein
MSRKTLISIVAIGLFAAATLASGAAQAHGGHGGHGGGGGGGGPHGGHGGHGGGMYAHHHFKHWHYWAHSGIYVRPVAYTVRESTPGPCTCLTKNYTPDGKVVFADLCTKESASAPVDGTDDHADANDRPANFAGQTYQDYLKANPQAQELKKN